MPICLVKRTASSIFALCVFGFPPSQCDTRSTLFFFYGLGIGMVWRQRRRINNLLKRVDRVCYQFRKPSIQSLKSILRLVLVDLLRRGVQVACRQCRLVANTLELLNDQLQCAHWIGSNYVFKVSRKLI